MAKKEDNFDKTFLILSAVIALGGAAGLFMAKGSFAEQLVSKRVTRSEQFPDVPTAEVAKASDMLRKSFVWSPPEIKGKPLPLNKSVPIILQDGKLVDLFTEETPLRAPMTNKYLRENNLDYLSPNVGDLDPDDDGFSNLEEFNASTNPKDAKSAPAVETKLYFVSRTQDDYILKLRNQGMPAQVGRLKPLPPKNVFIDTLPKTFGFDPTSAERFQATAFEMKKVGEIEVPQLTVIDNATKETLVLIYNTDKNLAEFQAQLEFRLKVVTPIKVKKGDFFYLPKVGTKYQLLDVTETEATVAPITASGTPGKSFSVKPRP